jgi:hypothetical protein
MLKLQLTISARFELEPTKYTLLDKYQAFSLNIKPKKNIITSILLAITSRVDGKELRCFIDEK